MDRIYPEVGRMNSVYFQFGEEESSRGIQMSNYLPRTQKKRERQSRLESDLRRQIAAGVTLDKLVAAAEDVRDARVRTVRADRQHSCFIGDTARYDAEIAAILATAVEVILAEFGWPPSPIPDAEQSVGSDRRGM
jgi:hypothetical protein